MKSKIFRYLLAFTLMLTCMPGNIEAKAKYERNMELSNEILDFIENYAGELKALDFVRWINANGLFSNMKSGSGWYREIIKEHNDYWFKRNRNAYSQLREFRKPKELSEEERSELFE